MGEVKELKLKDEIGGSEVVLITSESSAQKKLSNSLLDFLAASDDLNTVYVTLGKPYHSITEKMTEKKINSQDIFFIDCSEDIESSDADNCICIDPRALTDISIAITQSIKSLPGDKDKLLIVDNLTTLNLYNSDEVVAKFAHSLISKTRENKSKSILLWISDGGDPEIQSQISQFVDTVIPFTE